MWFVNYVKAVAKAVLIPALVAVGPALAVPAPAAAATNCVPGYGQAAVFEHIGYAGNCVIRNVGSFGDPASTGMPNDSVSSVKVGGGVRLLACRDSGFGGACEGFRGNDSDLRNNAIGNDQLSSLRVQRIDTSNHFDWGQCTRYAADRLAQYTGVYPGWWGNAGTWRDGALNNGWGVYNNPTANSIIVMQYANGYRNTVQDSRGQYTTTISSVGHVAWVEQVSGSWLYMRDMNWNGKGDGTIEGHWVYWSGAPVSFIYPNR